MNGLQYKMGRYLTVIGDAKTDNGWMDEVNAWHTISLFGQTTSCSTPLLSSPIYHYAQDKIETCITAGPQTR